MSPRVMTMLGVLLLVYGLGGLAVAAFTYAVAQASFTQVRSLSETVQGQQPTIREDLEQIGVTVGDAATATGGFAQSLDQARTSLGTASQAAGQLSGTFQQAGQIGTIEVFGMRPFAELAQSFEQSSQQFTTLSTELQATSDSLQSNVRDVQRVEADLREIRQRVVRVADQWDQTTLGGEEVLRSIQALQTAITGILAWIVIQSLAWLFAGILLLASARRGRHHSPRSGDAP